VEEITSRLKGVKDDGGLTGDGGDKLYLTEEEWLERYKQKESDGGRRGGGGSSGGGGSDSNGEWTGPLSRGKDKCHAYSKVGHWARECQSRPKREEQAHMVKDDEPTLMLAYVEGIQAPVLGQEAAVAEPWPIVTSSVPKRHVELVEAKVYVVLGDGAERDSKRWIFDTGASNHMTGIKEVFTDLDLDVVGTVRFGDGSVVRIEGCGTILFTCKNGEHRPLTNAYYIPRLTANIVSCGQLDEDGFQIYIEDGVMRIHDELRRLMVKIHHSAGWLYVLDLTIARLVCLAVCAREDAWRWHARFGRWGERNWCAASRSCLRWAKYARHVSSASIGGRRSRTKRCGGRRSRWSWYMGTSAVPSLR
jgi:hypothetical protein